MYTGLSVFREILVLLYTFPGLVAQSCHILYGSLYMPWDPNGTQGRVEPQTTWLSAKKSSRTLWKPWRTFSPPLHCHFWNSYARRGMKKAHTSIVCTVVICVGSPQNSGFFRPILNFQRGIMKYLHCCTVTQLECIPASSCFQHYLWRMMECKVCLHFWK